MVNSSIAVFVNEISCVIPDEKIKGYLLSSGIRKVNFFEQNSGADPSCGEFLLSREDLMSLDVDGITLSFVSMIEEGDTETITFENLIVTETTQLMTPIETTNSIFIVRIQDKRFYEKRDFIGVQHSLFPTTEGSDHDEAGTEWQEIIDLYWAASSLSDQTLNHDDAEYPTALIKDVEFIRPTSAIETLDRVLGMIGHRLFYRESEYSILPLRKVIDDNTTLLESADSKARMIQRKFNHFISDTFFPENIDVVFRPSSPSETAEVITINNQGIGGEGVVRSVPVFNRVSQPAAEREALSGEIAELIFDGYQTANSIDCVFFGLINVKNSPSCNSIMFYHDLISNSIKTKVKSHTHKSTYLPETIGSSESETEDIDPSSELNNTPCCGHGQLFICSTPDGVEWEDVCSGISPPVDGDKFWKVRFTKGEDSHDEVISLDCTRVDCGSVDLSGVVLDGTDLGIIDFGNSSNCCFCQRDTDGSNVREDVTHIGQIGLGINEWDAVDVSGSVQSETTLFEGSDGNFLLEFEAPTNSSSSRQPRFSVTKLGQFNAIGNRKVILRSTLIGGELDPSSSNNIAAVRRTSVDCILGFAVSRNDVVAGVGASLNFIREHLFVGSASRVVPFAREGGMNSVEIIFSNEFVVPFEVREIQVEHEMTIDENDVGRLISSVDGNIIQEIRFQHGDNTFTRFCTCSLDFVMAARGQSTGTSLIIE